MISMKNMEKKKKNLFPAVGFQGTPNFKTTSSNAVKICTHPEDI